MAVACVVVGLVSNIFYLIGFINFLDLHSLLFKVFFAAIRTLISWICLLFENYKSTMIHELENQKE